MMRLWGTVALALVVAGQATAQGGVAGKWTMDFPTAVRNEGGSLTVEASRKAIIVLGIDGDSVTGTWQLSPDSTGTAPKPLTLAGARHDGRYTITSEPTDRRVSINGDISTVRMATRYDFAVRNDSLVGTLTTFALDGSFDGSALDFTAVRARP